MGGSFTECTIRAGKPTVTVELNNSRRLDPVSVEAGVRGVCNVMRLLGMVDGEVVKQDTIQVLPDLYSRAVVISDKGGLVNILKGPGEPVTKGEVFLQIRNPFGDLVDEVVSPVTGYVLAYPMQKNQAAGTGDYLAFLITPYLGDFLGA